VKLTTHLQLVPRSRKHGYIARWKVNIKVDIREIGWGGMDWIRLAQDRHKWKGGVKTVMNLRIS
jgi:hypothetical protein